MIAIHAKAVLEYSGLLAIDIVFLVLDKGSYSQAVKVIVWILALLNIVLQITLSYVLVKGVQYKLMTLKVVWLRQNLWFYYILYDSYNAWTEANKMKSFTSIVNWNYQILKINKEAWKYPRFSRVEFEAILNQNNQFTLLPKLA